MTVVLRREEDTQRHTGRRSYDDADRDWSEASRSQ